MIIAIVKHFNYLFWHKVYVFRAGVKRGVPLRQLLVHDWSKFLPSEFVPYTRRFFLGREDPETQLQYELAFGLHCSRSPHHWEHWVVDGYPMKMPRQFALEMLADWDGAGMAKNGKNNTVAWYLANREHLMLHVQTRALIENELFLKQECPHCKMIIGNNVSVLTNEDGCLPEDQRVALLTYIGELHVRHS
ncbi:MAG: DUF5662 family protein [Gemmatimonadota bacterium]